MEEKITKLQIDTVYSEEKGEYSATFHYRLAKELEVAKDHSTGEPAEAYTKVIIEYKDFVDEETLNRWHQSRAPLEFAQKMTPEERVRYITPISEAEFNEALGNEAKQ